MVSVWLKDETMMTAFDVIDRSMPLGRKRKMSIKGRDWPRIGNLPTWAQAVTSVIKLLAKTSGRIRGLLEVEIRSGDEMQEPLALSLSLRLHV
ncbi:hypothetical protein HZ326_10469 [Fusarium oxysporum f. sp. albedinis]|nr:hypothetical protein HZ326_10469 [Fusarium oxysporum f. sp. albedinis]